MSSIKESPDAKSIVSEIEAKLKAIETSLNGAKETYIAARKEKIGWNDPAINPWLISPAFGGIYELNKLSMKKELDQIQADAAALQPYIDAAKKNISNIRNQLKSLETESYSVKKNVSNAKRLESKNVWGKVKNEAIDGMFMDIHKITNTFD